MYDLFIAPLTETYFQKALIGGSIVALVAGVVGCLVVLRRMAFLGDALSHAMIAGVAGGYLVMKMLFGLEAHAPGMLLGSLIAAVTRALRAVDAERIVVATPYLDEINAAERDYLEAAGASSRDVASVAAGTAAAVVVGAATAPA